MLSTLVSTKFYLLYIPTNFSINVETNRISQNNCKNYLICKLSHIYDRSPVVGALESYAFGWLVQYLRLAVAQANIVPICCD